MTHILIIEDTIEDRYLYKEYLLDEGYKFTEVSYADEALGYLKENRVDLILLDWKLPRMSGEQFLKTLKTDDVNSSTPVIVITGFDADKVIPNSLNFEFVDFISKPVSKPELNVRIKNMLRIQEKEKKMIAINMELSELYEKEQILQNEMAQKRSEMASLGSQNDQITIKIRALKENIIEVQGLLSKDNIHEEAVNVLKKIGQKIDGIEDDQARTNGFKDVYGILEPEFINHLHTLSAKLTPLDIKHCMYLRMNLINEEISKILNIDSKSVQLRTSQLKEKLNLAAQQDLRKFISSV